MHKIAGTPFLLLFAIVFASFKVYGQQPDTSNYTGEEIFEQQFENYIERTDSETDLSDWLEDLKELRNRPVNINSINEEELRRLVLINELQIKNLMDYVSQYGELASIYELQVIEGFNEEIVSQLIPYITLSQYVPEKFKFANAVKYGSTNILLRYQRVLQPQKGYLSVTDSMRALKPNNYYSGSADALLTRIQYTYKDYLKIGFVAEKDHGETLFPKSDTIKKGFDYYSGHFFLKNIGSFKQIAIGDYHVQFGQGLTLWSGFTMGKTPGSIVMRKRADALRPHASSNEYAFMRGIATTLGIGNFQVTVFYSNRKQDANVLPSDSISQVEDIVSALQQSGYHRVPSEIADKNAIREMALGGHAEYRAERYRVGATLFHVDYSKEFEQNSELYKKFYPNQNPNTYLGLDYSFNYKKLTLYGEASKQLNAGTAVLQGMTFSPDPRIAFAIIYRNYQKNYQNNFSAAFGESSANTNEKGLYLGMMSTLSKKITVNTYADLFRYVWMRYRVDAPSGGQEYAIQLTYTISRRGDIIGSYRHLVNPINTTTESQNTNIIKETTRDYFRLQLNYQALQWLKLQSRVELTYRIQASNEDEKGYMIYQGFQIKPESKKWTLNCRYSLFDTDSYDTRLYAYENDVPYAFSVPAFSGKGSRFYIFYTTELNERITLMLRYGSTWYSDRTIIGSGLDEIEGNRKSDVKAVLRLKL